jgi:hypothetical protein
MHGAAKTRTHRNCEGNMQSTEVYRHASGALQAHVMLLSPDDLAHAAETPELRTFDDESGSGCWAL